MLFLKNKQYRSGDDLISVFKTIKENIAAADVAEYYGIKKCGKLFECPFHPDNTPSMQVDERYYCHGCGATGDAVDLAAKIFNLRPIEAAEKIAADFGLIISDSTTQKNQIKIDSMRDVKIKTISNLIEYEKTLKMLMPIFAPKPDDETMSQAFLITRRKLDMIDDIICRFYQNPTDEELKNLITESNEIMEELNER